MPEHRRPIILLINLFLCRFIGHQLMNRPESPRRLDIHAGRSLSPASTELLESYPIKRRINPFEIAGHGVTVAQRSKPSQIISYFILFYLRFSNDYNAKLCRGFESLPFRQLIFNELRPSVANSVAKEVPNDL